MHVSGLLSGGAPVVKKYQINADVDNAGIPLLVGGADEAGLDLPTTTAVNDMVGINLDTATYVTAQQTDGTSAERTVSVVINPDAIIKARLAAGATSGVALASNDVDTASASGLAVTAGDYNTVDMDEGIIWCISGANVGQRRKITSTATTAATVTVAFDNDTVVGDVFLHANVYPMDASTPTLTSDFTELSAQVAVATNTAEFAVIDMDTEGTLDSYAYLVALDHILNKTS